MFKYKKLLFFGVSFCHGFTSLVGNFVWSDFVQTSGNCLFYHFIIAADRELKNHSTLSIFLAYLSSLKTHMSLYLDKNK